MLENVKLIEVVKNCDEKGWLVSGFLKNRWQGPKKFEKRQDFKNFRK